MKLLEGLGEGKPTCSAAPFRLRAGYTRAGYRLHSGWSGGTVLAGLKLIVEIPTKMQSLTNFYAEPE
jgi:hypothetical protein